ncbi:MAG: hypothetical protein LWX02_13130, partial [Deltaproteobacteria bacterium]|nr:hypothetical protein [Deltaproteobacteria bacterium]
SRIVHIINFRFFVIVHHGFSRNYTANSQKLFTAKPLRERQTKNIGSFASLIFSETPCPSVVNFYGFSYY